MPRYFIVDNDGGLDDAWAIFILEKLLPVGDRIVALTCVHGNTDIRNVCANNLRILAELKKFDVPVFKGAASPLIQMKQSYVSEDLEFFFGRNGFSDIPLPTIDLPSLQEENAIVALHRLSKEFKGEITLVCSGPLTNIALATRTFSDFAENIKEIYVMGGNHTAAGNTTMCAEFNFYRDPEAAQIVLQAFEGKMTLVPWETCLQSKVPFEWRYNLASQRMGPVSKFLSKIELPVLERAKRVGLPGYVSADSVLAAIIVQPGIATEVDLAHGTVELAGVFTRGQVVIDHLRQSKPNMRLVKSVKGEEFENLFASLSSY